MANRQPTDRCREMCAIADRMFSRRDTMESLWQEIAEQFYPERADFTTIRAPGQEFADHLMTSYPVLLRRDLASAVQAMLRPKGREWFRLSTGREEIDEQDDVSAWFDRANRTFTNILYDRDALFVRSTTQADNDFVTFGNAPMTVETHPSGVGLFFRAWHLRDVAWEEGDTAQIETVARKVPMTARAMIQRFGDDKVANEVKTAARNDPYTEFQCYSIIVPAGLWEYSEVKESPSEKQKRQTAFPWMALYLDKANNHVLQQTPIRRNPWVIPRWAITTQSVYAYSPATIVGLPDARLLQRMTLSMLESAEKATDPPLLSRGETLRGGVQLFAGGITYVDPEYDDRTGKVLEPVFETQAFEPADKFYERQMMLLRDMFYISKLTMPDTHEMTAYETARRVEEHVREVLPLLEPLDSEYNGALLEKALEISIDNQAFGLPETIPEALQGEDIKFTFKNPLQAALDEMKAKKLENGLMLVGGIAQMDPSAPLNINSRTALRDSLRGLQWPEDWLVPEDEVEQAEQAQAKAAQTATAVNTIGAGAAAAEQVGNAVTALKGVAA